LAERSKNYPVDLHKEAPYDPQPIALDVNLRTMLKPTACMRCLAAVLVSTLLTVRLGCFTEEVFVTPVEDCLFDSAFIAAGDEGQGKLRNFLKASASLDGEPGWAPLPAVILHESVSRPQRPPALLTGSYPDDIFIPPESLSGSLPG